MTFQAPDYNYWQVSTGSRTTRGDLKPQPNTNHALHPPPGASPHLLPPCCGPSSTSQPLPFLQDALQHLCSLWSHKPQLNSIQRRRIHLPAGRASPGVPFFNRPGLAQTSEGKNICSLQGKFHFSPTHTDGVCPQSQNSINQQSSLLMLGEFNFKCHVGCGLEILRLC